MAKIPFDIKYRPQIESGEYKVETSDGYPARIICWDSTIDEDRPIICIVFDNQIEQYKADGRYDYEPCNYDLFLITPEPELSEFEKELWEIMKSEGSPIGPMDKFTQDDKRVFHTYSNQLLNLARKELTCQGNIVLSIEDFEKRHMEAQEIGRKEALKDLPRWVKVNEGVMLDKYSKYLLRSNEGCYYYCCGTTITRDGYMLLVDNLEKLLKEDEK